MSLDMDSYEFCYECEGVIDIEYWNDDARMCKACADVRGGNNG
jgi:hypothetical protein